MKKLNKKGFTLIELIVVIAIIAALMLILVPTMNGFTNTAKKQANTANAKAAYTAIVASETAKTGGLYTTDLAAAGGTASTGVVVAVCGTTGFAYEDFWSGSAITDCVYTPASKTVKVGTGSVEGTYVGS